MLLSIFIHGIQTKRITELIELAHILSNSRSFDIFLYHVWTSPNIKWVDRATTKNAVPLENFSYVFYLFNYPLYEFDAFLGG